MSIPHVENGQGEVMLVKCSQKPLISPCLSTCFQIIVTCRTFGRPELHPSTLLARNILHEQPVRRVSVVQNDFHILLHESPLGHIQGLLDRGTSSRVGKIPSCKARHSRL